MAPVTSSTSPPQPRTSASSPSLSRCPCTPCQPDPRHRPTVPRRPRPLLSPADFFNGIGHKRTVCFRDTTGQRRSPERLVLALGSPYNHGGGGDLATLDGPTPGDNLACDAIEAVIVPAPAISA